MGIAWVKQKNKCVNKHSEASNFIVCVESSKANEMEKSLTWGLDKYIYEGSSI